VSLVRLLLYCNRWFSPAKGFVNHANVPRRELLMYVAHVIQVTIGHLCYQARDCVLAVDVSYRWCGLVSLKEVRIM
jgi:hypothetical protein